MNKNKIVNLKCYKITIGYRKIWKYNIINKDRDPIKTYNCYAIRIRSQKRN